MKRAGLVSAACMLLSGCGAITWVPAGPIADAERTILLNALAIMLCIVVPTGLTAVGAAWWFRASNTRAKYRPDFSHSGRIELVTWSIPALVVLFLGGIAWFGSHELDPARPIPSQHEPVTIQVVALDWKWLFIYPEQGIATINQVVAPARVPLNFQITSATVLNVFFVPELGSEIYAMNGMTTQVNLLADRPGTYFGLSAMFSGDGFPNMFFNVDAVPQAQFDDWVNRTRSSGSVLDEAAYRGLLKQTLREAPRTYRAVMPSLFQAIVTQKLPPGEGPETGESTSVFPERKYQ